MADEFVWMDEPANGVWSTLEPNWNDGEEWLDDEGHTAIFGVSTQHDITVGEALSLGGVRFMADGYRLSGESLRFSGALPFIDTQGVGVTSRLETAIYTEVPLTKTGAGVLVLGIAPYNDDTNVQDVVVAEGVLRIEEGRVLCSTGTWSIAGGTLYEQFGGTNRILSGGNILLVGQGGATDAPAVVEVSGGILSIPSQGSGNNSYMILGKDRDARLRIAESGSVQVVVIEMHQERVAGSSAAIQLDGGRLTVNRITGAAGANGTVSRILFNGGELYAGGSNSSFLGDMTEALVQAGGAVITVPSGRFYKTTQVLAHDPALGEVLDGGLVKRGAGDLYLQANNSYNGIN